MCSREARLVRWLIGGMVVARMIAAMSIPLLASEAYYWLWGQFPAGGYFDHPPMVGWLSGLFFGWVKGSELAARSAPIVFGALTTWVVYLLGRDLFKDRRTGWHAALLFSLVPIFDAGSILLQPDNGLMGFMALTWLFLWRAVKDQSRLKWWLLTGITAGLALLSKFHAWVMLPPLYLFLFISPSHRKALKTPGPWIAIAIALVVLSPNLVWNLHHNWLTYRFQFHRSGLAKSHWNPLHLSVYLAGPLATLSPLVYLAVVAALWKGLFDRRLRERSEVLFLILAGAPLPLFLLPLSLFVSISLHWPACAYIPLVILTTGLLDEGKIFRPAYWQNTVACCAGLLAMIHLSPYFIRLLPDDLALPFFRNEVNAGRLKSEITGWRELGDELQALYRKSAASGPTFMMTPDFHLAAQLAFYTRLPDCFQVLIDKREHAFEFWEGGDADHVGASGIIVVPIERNEGDSKKSKDRKDIDLQIGEMFQHIEKGPELPLRPSNQSVIADSPAAGSERRYQVVYGSQYRGESEPSNYISSNFPHRASND